MPVMHRAWWQELSRGISFNTHSDLRHKQCTSVTDEELRCQDIKQSIPGHKVNQLQSQGQKLIHTTNLVFFSPIVWLSTHAA